MHFLVRFRIFLNMASGNHGIAYTGFPGFWSIKISGCCQYHVMQVTPLRQHATQARGIQDQAFPFNLVYLLYRSGPFS